MSKTRALWASICAEWVAGQLIWYDFGMMSEIAAGTKDRLLDMFYAVYKQDADAVISCLVDLGIIVPTGDTLSLKRAISFFLENISRQAERQETLGAIGAPTRNPKHTRLCASGLRPFRNADPHLSKIASECSFLALLPASPLAWSLSLIVQPCKT